MRKIGVLFFIVFGLLPMFLFAQEESPADHYNALIGEHNIVSNLTLDYASVSVHSEDQNLIDQKRKEIIGQIVISINKIKALKPFKGDEKLKTECIRILELEKLTYEKDFNEAMVLKKDSKSSFEAMESYMRKQEVAELKMQNLYKELKTAQADFAKKYELKIENTSDQQSVFAQISSLNKYTRNIFLSYFKITKHLGGFLEATNAQDAVAMEKSRALLAYSSKEGMLKVQGLGPYDTDDSYSKPASELMSYYYNLAEGDFKFLVTTVQNKNKITNDDMTKFNKIINDFNAQNELLNKNFTAGNRELLKHYIPKR